MKPSSVNRLRIGFALAFALLAGVAIVGVAHLSNSRSDFEDKTKQSFSLQITVERMQEAFANQNAAVAAAPQNPSGAKTSFTAATRSGDEAQRTARSLAAGLDPAAGLLTARIAAGDDWERRIAKPLLDGDIPPPSVQTNLADKVTGTGGTLIAEETERRAQIEDDISSDTSTTNILVGVGLVAGLIAALLLLGGLMRSMRNPLEQLVGAAGKLADGDLRARVSVGGPAETVKLGSAFNEMADELQVAYRKVDESRHRLAVTLESLSDGVITVDESGTVTDANPAAKRMLPWADTGTPIRELLVGPLPAGRVERLLAGRELEEVQIEEGDEIFALTASKLGAAEGGSVMSIRNVSERARVEQMKNEFVLTASHELRSPLTSVQGFAELLILEREKLDDGQAETVQIILDNSRHLVRLLNDLLDLARSDVGRLSIHPVPTEVAPLVEDVVRTLSVRADEHGQTLAMDLAAGLPEIQVEPDRIRQVLINLLTNAIEYSQEGATVRVSAARVGSEVEIAVADTGPGIAPKELEHLFERFQRGDAGLTQRVGGTGLGLAISRSLVELHGGAINATSTVGKGSIFRVVLPAIIDSAASDSGNLVEGKS